jgi:hypothetical protein
MHLARARLKPPLEPRAFGITVWPDSQRLWDGETV